MGYHIESTPSLPGAALNSLAMEFAIAVLSDMVLLEIVGIPL
jgi:hypothetical protein